MWKQDVSSMPNLVASGWFGAVFFWMEGNCLERSSTSGFGWARWGHLVWNRREKKRKNPDCRERVGVRRARSGISEMKRADVLSVSI